MTVNRPPVKERLPGLFLLAAVFVIAVCGLIYELLAASLSSYLLGASVTHFSIVIGVFLTAMGLGSYLTRFVEKDLPDVFIGVQIGIGLAGGLSAALLLLTFSLLQTYLPVLVVVLTVTGTLVGMEIPILIRILRTQEALRLTVSNVLALDYLGALIASCAFPLILVPYIGFLRTAFVFGLINVGVAGVGLRVLTPLLRRKRLLSIFSLACALVLVVGLVVSGLFTSVMEQLLYQDEIIFARQTPYQRLVVTKWHQDVRLFIDGALQFSSADEHRYHEALVHPAMAVSPGAKRVLILGGGDGMAAREVLKYRQIERIDLVDLDREMVELFRDRPLLAALSERALSDPRMTVHIADAGKFLEESADTWDLILIDLPDPNNLSLARLYTTSFYKLVSQHLSTHGIAVTQATSPFYAPEAFWCVVKTWESTPVGPEGDRGLRVYPYHVYVPSFGDWGFVMAARSTVDPKSLSLARGIAMKFLTDELLATLFVFPQDSLSPPGIEANRLDTQIVTTYYRRAWRRFGP